MPPKKEDPEAENEDKSKVEEELEESVIEFNESVIITKEHRDNFDAAELKQGVNLFGRCYQ